MIQDILWGFTSFLRRNSTASMAVLPAPTMMKSLYFWPKTGRSLIGAHLALPCKEKGRGLLEGTTTFMYVESTSFLKETEYCSSDNKELNCPLP